VSELTPHARHNQAYWTTQAPDYAEAGRRNWEQAEPRWGIWEVRESSIGVLPEVDGLDVVELGCGTAYWSAWLARRGARPVGVDLTPAQLATARELQAEHGLEFPLVQASAEAVPLPDASFDLAFSEYGASLWCEPERWIAEAARLLRPGGRLLFLTNSPLVMLCTPLSGAQATERLERPQFGMRAFTWPDEDGIEFHLPHGEMIRVLREAGFEVEALHELQRPDGAPPTRHDYVGPEWSSRWPCEEIWRAVKRA
jgi:SAM-dependent methyltransferase